MTERQVSSWVVTAEQADLPDQVVEEAVGVQATLADKLSILRSIAEPFPAATTPMDADRWVHNADPNTGSTDTGLSPDDADTV